MIEPSEVEKILKNYEKIAKALYTKEKLTMKDYQDLVCAKQMHASSVSFAQEKDRGKGALSYENAIPDTDALITDKKNLPLAVFTADCPFGIFV
jgi:copper oxidase (laccase) domain-containing protein